MKAENVMVKLDNGFELMLGYAVRYALGRCTYAPAVIIEYIEPLLKEISLGGKILLKKDIDNYLEDSRVVGRFENDNRKLWVMFANEIGKSIDE